MEALERDAARLRRTFRRIVSMGILLPALPVAAEACDSSKSAPVAVPDASTVDAGANDAGLPDTGNLVGEAAPPPDAFIAWCDAGPPVVSGAIGGCYYAMRVPCGLPDGVVPFDNGQLMPRLCSAICTADPHPTLNCFLTGYVSDAGVDAADGAPGAFDSGVEEPDGATLVKCEICQAGRRPAGLIAAPRATHPALGAHLARSAHMESASIVAFERLERELVAVGAPRALVRQAARAAKDEARHFRVTARLSKKHGGRPVSARVRTPARARPRSLEALALENAVEGCVYETFAALVATWQGSRAQDAEIARAMRRIAADETRHAALAWAFARWAAPRLGVDARRRVERAQRRALGRLRESLSVAPPVALVHAAGVPTSREARVLVEAMATELGL